MKVLIRRISRKYKMNEIRMIPFVEAIACLLLLIICQRFHLEQFYAFLTLKIMVLVIVGLIINLMLFIRNKIPNILLIASKLDIE